MDKIGITYHLGHGSPVFDVARNLVVVSAKDGQTEGREEMGLRTADPFLRVQELKNLGVDVVICGAISRSYETALSAKGISHRLCLRTGGGSMSSRVSAKGLLPGRKSETEK